MRAARRAVFLDRDGVLNIPEFREGRSFAPRRLEDFTLYEDAAASVAALKTAGFLTIAVTNQPDIGAGLVRADIVAAMHERLVQATGIDAVYVSPHTRKDACSCRKPNTGMLIKAVSRFGIDLSASFMVGDRISDVLAGQSAGCRTVFIDLGYTAEDKPAAVDHICTGVAAAADWILEHD